jgi:two-component system chemotaxis response regulator CheY
MSVDYPKIGVLVVEDDSFTRALIRRMLNQIGVISVTEAADGDNGYREVLRVRPHVVFCDVDMQPTGGRAFLTKVRESAMTDVARTPVVFLTADAQRDTVLFAKAHQVSGYLVKPVSINDLKTRIDTALGAR